MSPKLKKRRLRIVIALLIFAAVTLCCKTLAHWILSDKLNIYIIFILYLVPYLISGYDVIRKAVINISHGHVFDENFLMMIATVGAFAIGEYPEGCSVMIFYQVGELFQDYAVGKSRESITAMMDIAPEYANLKTDEGIEEVDPDDVELGSLILIKPGEKVPLDGIVEEGESFLDTSALTGESVPQKVCAGERIISGCVNGEGTLTVRTTALYDDSTVARILELTESAAERKSRTENFITRFARWYTPIVTVGALILAVLPPLLLSGDFAVWQTWIYRACVFLVVSCPCALVISVPLGFFAGIGAASKIGVLVKGSNYLEALAGVDRIAFDKTGTLTKGEFVVTELIVQQGRKDKLLKTAAYAESCSNHPIAESIIASFLKETGEKPNAGAVSDITEKAGYGISCVIDGENVLCGSKRLMDENSVECVPCEKPGTHVYVAVGGILLGIVIISDVMKQNAPLAIRRLKERGISKTIMLTGDTNESAKIIAQEAGVDEYHAGLLPQDKLSLVESLIKSGVGNPGAKRRLAFVGDGINDAPVIMRSDVGIAMGSMGSDAAIEAADIVIMDDDPAKIPVTISIARQTMKIVKQNIILSLGVKITVLILGAFGFANMWMAVFADVGVCVLAILNSMRMLGFKEK